MHAMTKGVLGQMGFWDDATSEAWFQDARVDGIEVFAMSGFPYQPIVMDSVMEPIARGWLKQSNTQHSREAFWQFKRARLLGEAIPADPRVISSMIRGWYVAKALGRLDVEHRARRARAEAVGVGCRHPARWRTSRIRSSARATRAASTIPGVVMQSLTDRARPVQLEGTLAPLAAYRALAALGGDQGASVAGADRLAPARRRRQGRSGAEAGSGGHRGRAISPQRQQALRELPLGRVAEVPRATSWTRTTACRSTTTR